MTFDISLIYFAGRNIFFDIFYKIYYTVLQKMKM